MLPRYWSDRAAAVAARDGLGFEAVHTEVVETEVGFALQSQSVSAIPSAPWVLCTDGVWRPRNLSPVSS